MFFGIFQPKWKHYDSKVRMQAVLKLKDHNILEKIARNDPDPHIRKATVVKLTNDSLLGDIQEQDKDINVRNAAKKRYFQVERTKKPIEKILNLSPLHLAVLSGNAQQVSKLVVAGSNVNILDELSTTPLDMAVIKGHDHIAKILRNSGAKEGWELAISNQILAEAAKNGNKEGVDENLKERSKREQYLQVIAGEKFGRLVSRRLLKEQYELLSEVGSGGFGVVYRAKDIHLDQFVAIKELMLGNPTSLKEEAKVLSELRHKNVVGFRQLFPDGDRWYMVMDYVEGGSLARLIDGKALYQGTKEQVLQRIMLLGAHIAEGLNCAHEHGVIHQDVKPANVMVSLDGTAKVSDFGLAKARPQTRDDFAQGGQQSILVSMNGMTQAYCSPEQAAGRMLTKKTDTWSWGILMMEIFIGEVIWLHGTAAPQVLRRYIKVGGGDKDIPEMPRHVAILLERCFKEEPNVRPNMREIIRVLIGLQNGARGNWLSRFFK